MSRRAQTRWGVALAVVGLSVILVELGRYWLLAHAIHAAPVSIGAGFVFTGGWLIDPTSAEQWSGVLTTRVVTLIAAVRDGRRDTDRAAKTGPVVIPKVEDRGGE